MTTSKHIKPSNKLATAAALLLDALDTCGRIHSFTISLYRQRSCTHHAMRIDAVQLTEIDKAATASERRLARAMARDIDKGARIFCELSDLIDVIEARDDARAGARCLSPQAFTRLIQNFSANLTVADRMQVAEKLQKEQAALQIERTRLAEKFLTVPASDLQACSDLLQQLQASIEKGQALALLLDRVQVAAAASAAGKED
jgi:hypothetical protein